MLERAARANQLHGPVKIGLRVRELLGERQWIAGLDQHVEAPGLDLFVLRLGCSIVWGMVEGDSL